jgi:serine/threonine protein kinase
LQITKNFKLIFGGRYIEQNDHLSNDLARHVFTQIISALAYMHSRSVIHGDIKDENIVIDDQLRVRIIDFGSSKIIAPRDEGRLERFGGTINYCSPEILAGRRYSGRAYDIWCTGILLYTMLTGEVPFASTDDIKALNRRRPRLSLTREATDLIDWMLKRDPLQRPTADQVLAHPWISVVA